MLSSPHPTKLWNYFFPINCKIATISGEIPVVQNFQLLLTQDSPRSPVQMLPSVKGNHLSASDMAAVLNSGDPDETEI